MVSILANAIEKAKSVLVKAIEEFVKNAPNSYVEINEYIDFYKFGSTPEGEDVKFLDTCYVGALRVDEDGEVVLDYKDDDDAYVEVLTSFSFDELSNICEKINE